ncbi:keratin-associated protein 13-1-like [Ornithorhynchus anatinus]|uniref:Keratin-associated protein n=1 Tax=Ornithorhynchus anatinus TaxID=9258 RepID=F7C903_ORNAN|nr:keratin-associated protein 13-1-like [Ornithorhynchus anatinus]
MSYGSCSRSFSSRSLGGSLRFPASFGGSCAPSNLVYRTDACSPYPGGACAFDPCQETCCEPPNCQSSCSASSPCQPPAPCFRPRVSCLPSPCRAPFGASPGFGSPSFGSSGFGSGSCRPLGYGSSNLRSLGYGFGGCRSLGYGSSFSRPACFAPGSLQSSCYPAACGSGFY